jgi:broad specificity phosphatase PhoE
MPVPKFIFVRHGEAEHNVAFHEVGAAAFTDAKYRDAHLTPKGIQQARATGKALEALPILDIWSSPLTRCIQTAEEIYEEVNVRDLYLHDSLLERLGGGHVCNERKQLKELKEKYGMWSTEFLPDLPPFWGTRENHISLQRRMLSFVLLLARLYRDVPEGSYVLIVVHSDAISQLIRKPIKNAEHIVMTLEEILEADAGASASASASSSPPTPPASETRSSSPESS